MVSSQDFEYLPTSSLKSILVAVHPPKSLNQQLSSLFHCLSLPSFFPFLLKVDGIYVCMFAYIQATLLLVKYQIATKNHMTDTNLSLFYLTTYPLYILITGFKDNYVPEA